ncbi:CopG family transcriptional regulator [Halobellus salinisoli]|uniref:CopG family transcriptional regulator n=1 Tax=Halobellus salinisoli TaxID=3108500 RepID=UPI00300834F8
METEPVDDLPDELDQWVADRAAAEGIAREEFLRRLVDAHRAFEESDEPAEADAIDELETELRDAVDRIAAVENDLDEKISDVRQRVIQLKRETDAKASEEHDHPEIERQMNAGLENYESILEGLADTTEEHDSKLDRLGAAVVDARSRIDALERRLERREAVAELQREANRHGVTAASCGSCGDAVQLALLTEPTCPHCGAPFDGIEPKRFFFGTNRLNVGTPPAIESGPEADTDDSPHSDNEVTDR